MSAEKKPTVGAQRPGRPATADQLPEDVRALLAAVVEALDVPMPDTTDDARREHRIVLIRRASDVRIVLQTLLQAPTADLTALATDADLIRQWTAQVPADYPVWQPDPAAAEGVELVPTPGGDQQPGEPETCGRCRRPFDPADARFDGHARHGQSPWCRSCVDNCHEGNAEHVCVICDPARYGGEPR